MVVELSGDNIRPAGYLVKHKGNDLFRPLIAGVGCCGHGEVLDSEDFNYFFYLAMHHQNNMRNMKRKRKHWDEDITRTAKRCAIALCLMLER